MTQRLKEAAKTINDLVKREEDVRLALCKAIAGAMDLVKRESNLSWREWADQNLRKPDGSKWSSWTLYTYASYGRDPEKLTSVRKAIAENGRNSRRALNLVTKAAALPHKKQSGIVLDRMVESLMFAWKNASPEARKIFLEKITKERAIAS